MDSLDFKIKIVKSNELIHFSIQSETTAEYEVTYRPEVIAQRVVDFTCTSSFKKQAILDQAEFDNFNKIKEDLRYKLLDLFINMNYWSYQSFMFSFESVNDLYNVLKIRRLLNFKD